MYEVFKNHFHIEVRDGYGQTENTLLVGVTKGMEIKLGSMGKPTPGNHVEIIDDFGKPCAPGVVGDIAVHVDTPALFKEYFKDPERTSKNSVGTIISPAIKRKRTKMVISGLRVVLMISSSARDIPLDRLKWKMHSLSIHM